MDEQLPHQRLTISQTISQPLPTKPVEWEESLTATPKTTLQQCQQLSKAAHLKPLFNVLSANSSLLEAGCGLGQYVYAFASLGHECIGLDFSAKLLARAQTRAEGIPELQARTHWLHGDILNIPVKSESLDCHASFGVLEHFTKPQQRAILSEAYRVLKPGGILYLYVPHFWSVWTVRRQFRYWFRKFVPPHLVWQKNMSKAILRRLGAEAGFDAQHVQSFYATNAFATMALPSILSRFVPDPICRASATMAARLGQWCDTKGMLGYAVVYIGKKKA